MNYLPCATKKGWQAIVGIEPDKEENIDDIKILEAGINHLLHFNLHHQEMHPAHAEVENNIKDVAPGKYLIGLI